MSAPIIPINQSVQFADVVKTVNARDLHAFLEVGKDFTNWIKDRIEQYGFVKNIDYVVFAEIGENSSSGRPRNDYHISLDMAKELSMVERNAKGKQARRYFIECERRAKDAADRPPQVTPHPVIQQSPDGLSKLMTWLEVELSDDNMMVAQHRALERVLERGRSLMGVEMVQKPYVKQHAAPYILEKKHAYDVDIHDFLIGEVFVTGVPSMTLPVKHVVRRYHLWAQKNKRTPRADRSIQIALARLAGVYRDPSTHQTYGHSKNSTKILRGVRFV